MHFFFQEGINNGPILAFSDDHNRQVPPPQSPNNQERAFCRLPAEFGVCKGSHLRYFYDQFSDTCRCRRLILLLLSYFI